MKKYYRSFDRDKKVNNRTTFGAFIHFERFLDTTGFKELITNHFGVRAQRGPRPVVSHYDCLMTNTLLRFMGYNKMEHCYTLAQNAPALMGFRIPCPDMILKILSGYSVDSIKEPYVSEAGRPTKTPRFHSININERLNELLPQVIKCMKVDEQLRMSDYDAVVDIDGTIQRTANSDAMWVYKKDGKAYFPTVSLVNKVPVYIQNALGNTNASYKFVRILHNTFQALSKNKIKAKRFRSDAAAYQAEVLNYCSANDITYFIRAKITGFSSELKQINEESSAKLKKGEIRWKKVVLRKKNGKEITAEVASLYLKPKDTKEIVHFAVQRTKKVSKKKYDDESTVVQKGHGYVYRAVVTNHMRWSAQRVINYYNERGEFAENAIKDLKRNWNWRYPGSYSMESSTSHLFVNAIGKVLFQAYIQHLSEMNVAGISPATTISMVRQLVMDSGATITKNGIQWDKGDPFKSAA